MNTKIAIPAGHIKETIDVRDKSIGNGMFPIVTIGKGSYITQATIESSVDMAHYDGVHNFQIGKYTSIGENCTFIIDFNHDYKSVFQGWITAFNGGIPKEQSKLRRKGQILIGHDCWLGNNVTVLSGVTIHNGAVVSTGAVVTRDVPPYAIVAGVPAKVIGYRFGEDTIHKLMHIKWWNWSDEELLKNEASLRGGVEEFASAFYREVDITTPIFDRMTPGKCFLYYLDMNETYSNFERVIRQFAERYNGTDAELVLYFNPDEENFEENSERLMGLFDSLGQYDCYVNVCSKSVEKLDDLLSGVDCFITNRLRNTLDLVEEAYNRGIVCVSGVDGKIFEML